ncbi:MAG: hypothetical protein MJ124_00440 [Lachnospiraceae bacterium]|nr:hypothetical protein [Lachnospiraceae bacterium]
MNKKNKKTTKLIRKIVVTFLWIVTISGIIIEGVFFSYNGGALGTDNGFINFCLSFLNVFKIVQTDSNVEMNELYGSIPMWVFIWYMIANILAPILVAGVVIGFFTKWKSWTRWFFTKSRQPKILVFGQLEVAKKLAADNEDCQVIYYANDDDMPGNPVELLDRGIRVSYLPDNMDSVDEIRALAKDRADKVRQIFICYKQDFENKRAYETIYTVIEGRTREDKKFDITIFSDNTEIKYEVFKKLQGNSTLNIICESEALMPAKNIVTETLKACHEKCEDFGKDHVYGIITGFGSYGREILAMAINLCTLSENSRMCFDIVDDGLYEKMCEFFRRFDISVAAEVKEVDIDGAFVKKCHEFVVNSKNPNSHSGQVDGELIIRFYDTSVESIGFEEVVRNIVEEHDVDFVISCDGDAVQGTRAREVVNKEILIKERSLAGKEPVYAFSAKDDYIINNVKAAGLYSLTKRAEVQRKAKAYSTAYNALSGNLYAKSEAEKKKDTETKQNNAPAKPDADYIKKMEKADDGTSAFMQALHWSDIDSYKSTKNRPSVEKALQMTSEQFMEELKKNPDMEAIIATEHRRWCYCQLLRGYSAGPKSKIGKKHNLLVENDTLIANADRFEKGTNERIDAVAIIAYDLIPYCVNNNK